MRRRLIPMLACLVALCFAQVSYAAEKNVPKHLQNISVTVRSNYSSGSGTLVQTKDGATWVLTCGHVAVANRSERQVIVKGVKKTIVEFDDLKILIIRIKHGRKVGETSLDAEVIRYSDAEYGHDLTLLRIRDDEYIPKGSATFYLDKALPPIGAEMYHCGSLLGNFGAQSLTSGIMSQHGRLLFGKIFDQSTCVAFPGSSGGLVALKDGRYVGMVVRGAGEGFNLIVPVRRINKWAKSNKIGFILDPTRPQTPLDELRKGPIEDDTTGGGGFDKSEGKPHTKDFPFLIKTHKKEPQRLQWLKFLN